MIGYKTEQKRGKTEQKRGKTEQTRKQIQMQSKQGKCDCCLNLHRNLPFPFPYSIPNTLDHQSSANYTHSSTLHYDFATSTTSSLYPHTQFTNPDSLPTLPESFRRFTRAFPPYLSTVEADQIRADHYSHLSLSCLDYAGHSLFSFSQEEQQLNQFVASSSSSSSATPVSKSTQLELEEKLKARIFSYLNISEDDYSLFFTANQTSAFGVVAQSYPFQTHTDLLTVYDHENEAVEAMIKSSRSKGARVSTAEFKWPKLKIHCSKLEEMIFGCNKKKNKNKKMNNKGLFVFPLQSRVCGARYSYQWMNLAQENGWHVLLDATGLGPKHMDTLGLSLFRPDFLISTFYKIFGQDPSGFSCLFVKKSLAPILNHNCIQSTLGVMSLIRSSYTKFGHGEIEECGIECRGLDHADSLGLVLSSIRTRCLINWLVNALLAISHPNSEIGSQLVTIYGPRVRFDRGPALAFNVFDWKGEKVDPMLVQKLADRYSISLGCGFIKHLWFSKRYEEDKGMLLEKRSRENEVKSKGKKKGEEKCDHGIAVVTASLGFLTNFEDVYRLWVFVCKFLDADFVEKERWRYTALDQKTIEV